MNRSWLGVAAVLVGTAATAWADGAPTLQQYLESALKTNPQRRISRADVLNAEASRAEALSALLPTVSAQGNYTYNEYESKIPILTGFTGTTPVFQIVTISPHDSQDASLSARMPLFDGPAIARWRAARLAAKAAGDDDAVSEQELLIGVVRAYYGAIAAHELVKVANESKAAAEQNYKIAKTRVDAGTATQLQAARADLEIQRDEQVRIDATRAWQVARRQLSTLSGMPEPDSLAPPADIPLTAPGEEAWQKQAEDRRPELASTRTRQQVARLAQKASWLQYAPTITAHGVDRYSNAKGFTGQNTAYSVGVTADWQLLEFGYRYGETKKARAEVMRADAALERMKNQIRDDVHAAWLDVDAARAKREAARRGAEVAHKAADEMRTRFAAGTSTQLDVIQVERDLLSAEVDRIRAEADLALARMSLERVSGGDLSKVGS